MGAVAGQVAFVHERQEYRLEFDFGAIAFFERAADVSILDAVEAMQPGGGKPRISHLVWLVQAGLQKHHPGIDFDTAGRMITDPEVMASLGMALSSAMPDAAADGSAEGNGKRAPASTGTKRSGAHSKRD